MYSVKYKYPHKLQNHLTSQVIYKSHPPQNWVKLQNLSHYVRWAIIFSEDWRFYQHKGIDFEQLKIVLNEIIFENKIRGASTITQQMVKNLYLNHEKTFLRKIIEVILSLKAENNISKDDILEIYLNIIEFGPGIYGIGNASIHYFQKHPSLLNPLESAFLAMLLPNPKSYYVSFKNKKLDFFARERMRLILIKMRMGKILSPIDYDRMTKEKLVWE
jgi:monofunctional biosynthetic peptidoglycan transglycosylase